MIRGLDTSQRVASSPKAWRAARIRREIHADVTVLGCSELVLVSFLVGQAKLRGVYLDTPHGHVCRSEHGMPGELLPTE